VVKGAFKSWVKHSFSIRGVQVEVEVLPAISSEGWDERDPSDIVSELEQVFCDHLPEDQQPSGE
jgi:hypothetical protein